MESFNEWSAYLIETTLHTKSTELLSLMAFSGHSFKTIQRKILFSNTSLTQICCQQNIDSKKTTDLTHLWLISNLTFVWMHGCLSSQVLCRFGADLSKIRAIRSDHTEEKPKTSEWNRLLINVWHSKDWHSWRSFFWLKEDSKDFGLKTRIGKRNEERMRKRVVEVDEGKRRRETLFFTSVSLVSSVSWLTPMTNETKTANKTLIIVIP